MRDEVLRCPVDQPPWIQAIGVLRLLVADGYEAYLVGGCVRDLLMDRPVHDVDLATNAHPHQVEALCVRHALRCHGVGRAFGVMVVVTGANTHLEVATFRHDGAYIDGRRPATVAFSTAQEDVLRRDFTINALLFDPLRERVIDHVDGLDDVHARRLRSVGDPARRLGEDRLRVLRGLRFAAHLDLAIEPQTWAALCTTTLEGLSSERVVQEWFKGLAGARRGAWLHLLRTSGALRGFCPPLAGLPPEVLATLETSLDRLRSEASPALAGAVWLSGAGTLLQDWLTRLPGTLATRIHWLVTQAHQLEQLLAARQSLRRKVLQHPAAGELVELVAACAQSPDDHARSQALTQAWAWEQEQERQLGRWTRLVRASDLLALGARPGPALGAVLETLEDAQLEGAFSTRDQALAQAQRLLAERKMTAKDDGSVR